MVADSTVQSRYPHKVSSISPLRTRTSSLAFIQNKLRRSETSRSSIGSAVDTNYKGPLGLTLLSEPSEPRIDFIFIHGLGGGSRKTWCHSVDPGLFWPKEWLPNETGFKHVRIHSYGYNSDWTNKTESRLSVHDFGQALLADISNSPGIRKNGDTPIVLVAHSMGGLITKKAYLLATRDPTYKAIADRINSIYFLGTPHRGADTARTAKLIISSAFRGAKSFIEDLLPGSGTLDQINDEFRHVCEDLKLWSFFESVPTSFGITSALVVDKESAVLGLPRERTQFLQADHRHLCKFESPDDHNYNILKRSFLTTIEETDAESLVERRDEYKLQMRLVSSFLEVDKPEANLLALKNKQHHGTCQWLTDHATFQDWTQGSDDWQLLSSRSNEEQVQVPRILWLNGRPGTGKSVASGHAIRYLQACNFDCSFYFFKHNDKATSTVSSLLRSLAYQMAESSYEVRQSIVAMMEDDIQVPKDDHHMLWSKLFINRIFKTESLRPQFWIIDAIDECSNKGIPILASLLSNMSAQFPARVLITSRPGGQLERVLSQEKTKFSEINIGVEDSMKDIEVFLRARCPQVSHDGAYQDLVSDVLSKSNGIFLWASLTISRLEDIYSVEDMQDILSQLPTEMNDFYSRIIASVAASPSIEIVKCALKWAICAPTALTMSELKEAIRLDIDRTLTASPGQLEAMCGHLVSVDDHSRIQIDHQTIAVFLTKQKTALWVDQPMAHARLAETCLSILGGKEFSPPGTRRVKARASSRQGKSPLADYACANFSYHLMHCSSSVDTPLLLLDKFLRSNILTWIERIARAGNLIALRRTTQRLKDYLTRRAKYKSPISVEVQTVESWVTDLTHVVAAFGANLLASPSSIYFLVPHVCPQRSVIYRLFAKPTRKLKITGVSDDDWDDRLTCYLFPQEASSIACCDKLTAIGLGDGHLKVYNSSTFELVATLDHGKKVRNSAFSGSSSLLASCSTRKLMLWSTHRSSDKAIWSPLWSRTVDFTAGGMAFSPDDKLITLTNPKGSAFARFNVQDGSTEDSIPLHSPLDSDSSDGSDMAHSGWAPAELVRFDSSHKLAAVSYRNSSVVIWELEPVERIGTFEKEVSEEIYCSPPTSDMLFNPVPELELLAISYMDGDLVTCNPWTLQQETTYHLQGSIVILSSTSNGRILAGGDEDGTVHLFLFETLEPMYRIERPEDHHRIHDICFSFDDLRFLDIRGRCCNIWEPLVLVPRDLSDNSSSQYHSEELVLPSEATTSRARALDWGEAITTIVHMTDMSFVFAGREDGAVAVYELESGNALEKLALHTGFAAHICLLDWNDQRGLLMSVDTMTHCIITQISLPDRSHQKLQFKVLLNHREGNPVRQAFLSPHGSSLLISTESAAKLLRVDGSLVKEMSSSPGDAWMPHPTDPGCVVLVRSSSLHLFDWEAFRRLTPETGILLEGLPKNLAPLHNTWTSKKGSTYLFCALSSPSPNPTAQIMGLAVVDLPMLDYHARNPPTLSIHSFETPSASIRSILGVQKSTLFFLDTTGWVCSVALKGFKAASSYTRHFFIPLTWQTGSEPAIRVISKNAVAFGRGDQLVVFHGFLDFEEKVSLEGKGGDGTVALVGRSGNSRRLSEQKVQVEVSKAEINSTIV